MGAVMNVSSSELLRGETVAQAEVPACWYGMAVSPALGSCLAALLVLHAVPRDWVWRLSVRTLGRGGPLIR